METKFQTSFIPKKPLPAMPPGIGGGIGVRPSPPSSGGRRVASIYMILAVLVFLGSLAGVGGAYLWQQKLTNDRDGVNGYKAQLAKRENEFDIGKIQELQQYNVKITAAHQLLKNHLALSGIFDILSRLTIESVRFLSLDLTAPKNPGDSLKVSMQGYGTNLSSVAFQSDVLNQLQQYGLRNIVKNPIMSDPSFDQKGTVSFGFSASVDPTVLSYEKAVAASLNLNSSPANQNSANAPVQSATPSGPFGK